MQAPLLQGVGKGTYSERVADAYGMSHIAAGDLVREEIKKKTEIGKTVSLGAVGWGGLLWGGEVCARGAWNAQRAASMMCGR